MFIEFNYILNGYCTINSLGELNKNGVVTIFIKDNFEIISISNKIISDCNSIAIQIELNKLQMSVIGIYRSPQGIIDSFIHNLNTY